MQKKDRCVSDGCINRKAYSISFQDGVRGQYCEECTNYMQSFEKYQKRNSFSIKTVEPLQAVK